MFGVYLNLPKGAKAARRDEHLAGVVSFVGIEQAGSPAAGPKGRGAHPIRYSLDVTDVVERLRAAGAWDDGTLRVDLLPIEGSQEPEPAAAGPAAGIRVGAISLYAG